MRILLTGASGFLGSALIPRLVARGDTVYGLSRHPPVEAENLIPLEGNITKPDLGLDEVPERIEAIYHLAAVHKLGKDKDGSIWKTNVVGTENVIQFCRDHNVKRLYFCSTAYTIGEGRNVYEKSKILCEKMVRESSVPHVIVFKPSVVMGTKEHPYPGHFSQFVALVIKLHQRAELVRRKIEGTLSLPVLEPVFRVRGNPDGYLNLVGIDDVVKGMARIRDAGAYWLTHPHPPTLQQLFNWVGEFILLDMRFTQEPFRAQPIELAFQKMATAFEPYLLGDRFSSHLRGCLPITKELIHEVVKNLLTIDKVK